MRNAQGRVPYIKLPSFHEHIEGIAWGVSILQQPQPESNHKYIISTKIKLTLYCIVPSTLLLYCQREEHYMDITRIGKFLKTARKNKHLTQGYVAAQLGVSPQAVSKWERGENLPDIAFLPDIAQIYGIDVNEIFIAGQISLKQNTFEDDLKKLQARIDSIIVNLFDVQNYDTLIDEIMPYTNRIQRGRILHMMLDHKGYDGLESIIPYMNNTMKTEMLSRLLDEAAYEVIEDMIPIFTRKQRDMIATHFIEHPPASEVIENFIPFLDMKNLRRNNLE